MNPLLKNDVSRRQFVNNAAKTFLGVSALGVGIAPSITRAAGAGASPLKQVATAKRVIYLYMKGGMSHLDTFDPKPGQDIMGPTKTINTNVDGMRISEYLPRMAKQMNQVAVINSMTSTQGAHAQGDYMMHTSYEMRSSIKHPAMGAWLLKYQGKLNHALPGNVMIGNDSRHPGSGFFESNLSPVMISDPAGGLQNVARRKNITEEQFNFHLDLAAKLDQPFVEKYDQKNVRAYTSMYDDAIKLMKSKDLEAFEISDEPEWLRDRYGDNNFGQGCLLARRLIENDVRFVEVTFGSWDTHSGNFLNVPDKAEVLDQALSTLLMDLEKRGLLEDTLVVLATEFGRTPEINQNEGRDHHPAAFSCLLAGGGIRGGQVYGKSNEAGSGIDENPVKIPDLNATVGYALGMPLDQVIYSPTKRPFTLADKGKPLVGLFG